jgi:hypothetical protein
MTTKKTRNNTSNKSNNQSGNPATRTDQPGRGKPVTAIAKLHKSGTTEEAPRSKARIESDDDGTDTPFGAPASAMVHDLVGFALLALPAGLQPLIGDDALRSNALELENLEVLVIVRETGVVAYVHLPILVMEMEGSNQKLNEGGMVLKVISARKAEAAAAPTRPKAAPKAKPTASAKSPNVAKPAGKAGRHA